ncbi:MAG: glycosyltransferase family 2 protein [Moraxellaceae bacterium]|nr:glycosyltransferase family 2 protein [Moraxellaceae bacterium]
MSAVLVVRDCATQLPATLVALAFCDEIVVVDSGSRDDTVAVARAWGARVIEEPWRGFGPQKQFAIEQAVYDWVLCVDSDEVVSTSLCASIEDILRAPDFHVYEIGRRSLFFGRYLRYGEGRADYSARLFNRGYAKWSEDRVYEKVITLSRVGRAKGDLLCGEGDTLTAALKRQDEFSTLAARLAVGEGESSGGVKVIVSPAFRFIKNYFFRLGFMDGVPGLVFALMGAYSSFLKHAKMVELQRTGNGEKL